MPTRIPLRRMAIADDGDVGGRQLRVGRQDVLVGGPLLQERFDCRDRDAGSGEGRLGPMHPAALHDAARLTAALGGGTAEIGPDLLQQDDFGQDDLTGSPAALPGPIRVLKVEVAVLNVEVQLRQRPVIARPQPIDHLADVLQAQPVPERPHDPQLNKPREVIQPHLVPRGDPPRDRGLDQPDLPPVVDLAHGDAREASRYLRRRGDPVILGKVVHSFSVHGPASLIRQAR
jgi:hypothetical protein